MHAIQRITRLVAAAALLTVVVGQLGAQGAAHRSGSGRRATRGPRTEGLMIGIGTLGAQGVSISGADVDGTFATRFGAGAGLTLGYGTSSGIIGFASLDIAKQQSDVEDISGTFGLAHLEVGVRMMLPAINATTVPYAQASVGRRGLGARVHDFTDDSDYDMTLHGGMFGVGGGIEHAISPHTSLDLGASLAFGRFGQYDTDGERGSLTVNGTTSMRLRAGITWRP